MLYLIIFYKKNDFVSSVSCIINIKLMNKKREKKCFHVPVNCKQCGDITHHNKYYYKKMNGVVFCSQRCCVYISGLSFI